MLEEVDLSHAKFLHPSSVEETLNSFPKEVRALLKILNLNGLPLDGVGIGRFTRLKQLRIAGASFPSEESKQAFKRTIPAGVEITE
jgi:hypothetical protein